VQHGTRAQGQHKRLANLSAPGPEIPGSEDPQKLRTSTRLTVSSMRNSPRGAGQMAPQNLVASFVTQPIVDARQPIDVDDNATERDVVAFCLAGQSVHAMVKISRFHRWVSSSTMILRAIRS